MTLESWETSETFLSLMFIKLFEAYMRDSYMLRLLSIVWSNWFISRENVLEYFQFHLQFEVEFNCQSLDETDGSNTISPQVIMLIELWIISYMDYCLWFREVWKIHHIVSEFERDWVASKYSYCLIRVYTGHSLGRCKWKTTCYLEETIVCDSITWGTLSNHR